MIPWLINSMLCRLFFNTDLLHVFRRVPVTNLKITVRSYSHKVYPQTSLFLPLLHAIFLLRMVTPVQIKYRANGKPKTTKYLPAHAIIVYPYPYLLISSFFLSHLPFTLCSAFLSLGTYNSIIYLGIFIPSIPRYLSPSFHLVLVVGIPITV